MTNLFPNDGLVAFPIPAGSTVLTDMPPDAQPRALVIAALRQELQRRRMALPLGPETDLHNPDRLLQFNRVAVQLVTAGMLADQIAVPLRPWRNTHKAPQLLAAALVDDDNQVVFLQGVLTAQEMAKAAAAQAADGKEVIYLETSFFQGGIERLLTYVMVLNEDALPRMALASAPASLEVEIIDLTNLLSGQIKGIWFDLLNATVQPLGAAAFRGTFGAPQVDKSGIGLALQIPLGLGSDAVLVGDLCDTCVERFKLSLLPSSSNVEVLSLQVVLNSELEGDLLPDGLVLSVKQDGCSQYAAAAASTSLNLNLEKKDGLITISVEFPGRKSLELPQLSWCL